MPNPTDTNQASEDIDNILFEVIESAGSYSHKLTAAEADYIQEQAKEVILALIRTEKLKLLAEVRDAHRDGYMRGVNDFSNYFMDASNAAQRNPIMPDIAIELREAYRAPILSAKLEAEL